VFFTAEQVRRRLPWGSLIEAIRQQFINGCEMPVRHHHTVDVPGEPDATLLLMPAWQAGCYVGVKMVNVFPGNAERGLASISGSYLLNSGSTGELLVIMDGPELTARRTAAASALAAQFLAKKNARTLLMVGTGKLSANLIEAHSHVSRLDRILLWGRNYEKAQMTAEQLKALGFNVSPAKDLAEACAVADIISCATLTEQPLIRGEWLSPGTHIDLVGGFTPTMREADDTAIQRAKVFVDTREGATKEAGDIVAPLEAGIIGQHDILGDLYQLCRGEHLGRESGTDITLFKSVGAALEDLAAAIAVYESSLPGA